MNGRGKTIATWVISGLLFALFAFAGSGKLMSNPDLVENFAKWGYSEGFMLFIGVCEALGAVALLIPAVAAWAAAGLVVIMGGAAYTHVTHGEPFFAPVIAGVLLLVVIYLRRGRALFLGGGDVATTVPGSQA